MQEVEAMTTIDTLAAVEAAVNQSAAAICAAEHRQICFLMNVYVQPGAGINAWNTGFVIYVTKGAVDKLPADERAFAIAHEKAHGLNMSKDESAADALSVRIMARARSTIRVRYDFSEMGSYDPLAGAALMRRLGNPVTTLAWLTGGFMHYPSQGARARLIEDEARRVVPSYAVAVGE